MNKINTFSIQFVIRKHRVKDGKAPIYARITVNTSRSELSVKRRINADNWNNGKGIRILLYYQLIISIVTTLKY